jgi:SAM-dependent methyltransferase
VSAATPDGDYRVAAIGARARADAAQRGWLGTGTALADWSLRYAAGIPLSLAGSRREFELGGERFRYLAHRHKHSWLGERAVEVPVVAAAVARARDARVLEVGNVLSHYTAVSHEIVDKYERAPGVRNVDVMDLRTQTPYDLIVSISTLEHVGVDDTPRDPARAIAAVAHLRALLAPGARLLATVPVGYNRELGRAIAEGSSGFDEVRALVRVGRGLDWRERDVSDALALSYDRLLYRASAVLFCTATP